MYNKWRYIMKSEIDLKTSRHEFPVFPVVAVTVKENIIAIGLVHAFSFTPPMIGIGVHPKRYSYELLEQTKDFGVNIPTKDLVEKVNLCGTITGRNKNKFQEAGLTPMKAALVVPMTGLLGKWLQPIRKKIMTGKRLLAIGKANTGSWAI
jgi:flavin reductase (DIM6/NTAB) family NADH-FMN oxidoreductase RutF